MKPLPSDPMRQHARFMAAFTDDILARDYDCPRAKAVVEIARQTRKGEHPLLWSAIPLASAIEARRAETQGGSVADESAGPKDDAHTEASNGN